MSEPKPEWPVPAAHAVTEPPIRAEINFVTRGGSHVTIEIKSSNLAVLLMAMERAEKFFREKGGQDEGKPDQRGHVGPDPSSPQGDGQEPEPTRQP